MSRWIIILIFFWFLFYFQVSLTSKYILSELGSPGKSGSFFYFSQDYRFIIKTIHHAEHKFMRKILKDYFNVSLCVDR